MRHIKKIHFIGIGGVGMGGIAEVLLNQGYSVSGSDRVESPMTQRLSSLGVQVWIGHRAEQVQQAHVVVVSSAIRPDNVEWLAAIEHSIPVVQRAQMLAELMRFRYGIAVAGAHGKTTTTSLVTSILAEAGLDPTFVIGGCLQSAGKNAGLGSGLYLVAEADESDASFLCLNPMSAILTNIDADHLEAYQGEFEQLQQAYVQFIQRLPFYGLAIVCIDCPHIRALLPQMARPCIRYGMHPEADVQIRDIRCQGWTTHFSLHFSNRPPLDIQLHLAGHHNVLNASAAIILAIDLGIADHLIQKALAHFRGVDRRMQYLGEKKGVIFVDDYGHHPEEIRATLEAVRSVYPQKRLVMLFQPHRYTRTAALFEDFCRVLLQVDVLFVFEVYAAGEKPIPGADSAHLCRHLRQLSPHWSPVLIREEDGPQWPLVVYSILQEGDVVLSQGAGNVSSLARALFDHYA